MSWEKIGAYRNQSKRSFYVVVEMIKKSSGENHCTVKKGDTSEVPSASFEEEEKNSKRRGLGQGFTQDYRYLVEK